ncbi:MULTISPECIES: hypothetical protein [Nocardia]|uniref:hypothetical protein n=1 Tax=Nocardia TaxID=1817 RepID=UPI0007A3A151|nr:MULTISPECIES: hypothetical protein [Nocardia]NQE72683.1 hypothetical protein [Nocardia gamkensis]
MTDEQGGEQKRRRPRRRTDYSKVAVEGERTPKVVQKSLRTTPIRVTLDLKPKAHQDLKRWCNNAAVATGLPDVPLAPVLRILGEILVDPKNQELSERVKQELINRAEQQF